MVRNALRYNTKESRLIRLMLVFVLIFAAAHVALHDPDVTGSGGHSECQVCRLSHVPLATMSVPSLIVPVQFLVYSLSAEDTAFQQSHSLHTRQARAPPLV